MARRIAKITNLRLIHMDYFYYHPNWELRDNDDIIQSVVESIAEDGWVFDGNHSSTYELRAKNAEMIIWVRIPRWRCILNVCHRAWQFRGKTRPDMADGCIERLNWGFIKFIWNFDKRSAKIAKLLADNKNLKRTYELFSYAEIEVFVEKLKKETSFPISKS